MTFNLMILLTMSIYTSLPQVYCTGDFQCIGTCYSGQVTPEPQDIIHGKHLKGYSYKNITTDSPNKCYSSCVQDCRCKACQMQDTRCELLEEDKSSKSSDFVATASRYVYYDIKQTLYHGAYHMLPPGKCYNGCCKSQPCMNGGTCTEHCHDPKLKFMCTCPKYFAGTVCEKFTSCMSVWKSMKNGNVPVNGVYEIFNTATKTVLPVYCTFRVKAKRVWTLMESHSLGKRAEFSPKSFYDDTFSVNTHSPPSWDQYRLSPQDIKYVRSQANMFRATCDFPTRTSTFYKLDFLNGYLNETDITAPMPPGFCRKYKKINIRNNICNVDCTACTYGTYSQHLHIDTSFNAQCSYRPSIKYDANYFGFYADGVIDSSFTCTMSNQSTTQWWLGHQE